MKERFTPSPPSGEFPQNDCSPRHKTLSQSLGIFREDVRHAVMRYEMGHIGEEATHDLIALASRAILAIIDAQ